MRVRVEVWGPLRDRVPEGVTWVDVAAGSTVAEVAQALDLPDPHALLGCAFALDAELVEASAVVVEGAVVTLLPPVSGG